MNEEKLICSTCKKYKIKDEFPIRKDRTRGYDSVCRPCMRLSDKIHYKKEDKIKYRAKFAKKLQNPIEAEKQRVRDIFKLAVVQGKIKRGVCAVCGEKKTDGHHFNYSKPLEVIWLCRLHHAEVHRKTREEISSAITTAYEKGVQDYIEKVRQTRVDLKELYVKNNQN